MPVRNQADDLYKILPPSATALERDLTRITPFDAILDPAVKLLHRAKGDWSGWRILSDVRDRPILDENGQLQTEYTGEFWLVDGDGNFLVDGEGNYFVTSDWNRRFTTVNESYLFWLAVEYGVNYLSEILPDISDRINGGIALHRVVGTRAAITLIGSWLNFPNIRVIEERYPTIHFPEYQLDLGRYPTLDEVKTLVRSVRFGEPIRSRLRRVLYNYNRGRFIPDSSHWGDILDDYSGVRIDDLLDGHPQMKASFRRPLAFEVEDEAFSWDGVHTSS